MIKQSSHISGFNTASPKAKMNIARIIAWGSYDWASAAFSIIVTTFIFATYFTKQVAANEIIGTYQWANASAIAGILVAISGPIFGAIADHSGNLKRWLFIFTYLCILFTALLWFVYPHSSVLYALTCVVIATTCLEIGLIFYNSFLPHISPPDYIGRISGWAWGMGYIGGIVSLSIVLFVFIKPTPIWLDTSTDQQVRICALLTAAWFGLFSLPIFIFVPDKPSTGLPLLQATKKGLKDLYSTLRSLPKQTNLLLYLIAHLIYTDGLNTLFAFGGIYAAGTFGMNLSEVILFGITMNISAGIGAIGLAWVDDWIGSKPTILISLIFLTILCIPLLIVKSATHFWIFALTLCLFVGPVQAASRSLMARIIPIKKSTEMFGLYAFSGRITSFIGPWLLGWTTFVFNSQRFGMGTIVLFFLFGGILMCFVKEKPSVTMDHANPNVL